MDPAAKLVKIRKNGAKEDSEQLSLMKKINEMHNFDNLKNSNLEMKNY